MVADRFHTPLFARLYHQLAVRPTGGVQVQNFELISESGDMAVSLEDSQLGSTVYENTQPLYLNYIQLAQVRLLACALQPHSLPRGMR